MALIVLMLKIVGAIVAVLWGIAVIAMGLANPARVRYAEWYGLPPTGGGENDTTEVHRNTVRG